VGPVKHAHILEAAGILAVLLLLFFWPATLGGRVLLPADLVFDLDPLWAPLAPEGYTHPGNQLLADQVYQFFPWKTFTRRSLAQGTLPLWNPYTAGGQPFVGNGQSALFDPFNLLGRLFPLYTSYVVVAFLRLFVAGLSTYLFAREIGISKIGALLAMISFTFSGPMIVWLGYPLASVVAWLPAMLLCIERALSRRSIPYTSLLPGYGDLGRLCPLSRVPPRGLNWQVGKPTLHRGEGVPHHCASRPNRRAAGSGATAPLRGGIFSKRRTFRKGGGIWG